MKGYFSMVVMMLLLIDYANFKWLDLDHARNLLGKGGRSSGSWGSSSLRYSSTSDCTPEEEMEWVYNEAGEKFPVDYEVQVCYAASTDIGETAIYGMVGVCVGMCIIVGVVILIFNKGKKCCKRKKKNKHMASG